MSADNIESSYTNTPCLSSPVDTICPESSPPENHIPPLEQFLLSGKQLTEYHCPPVEILIDPFLKKGSLALVHAKRGVGKSWFIYEMALALTRRSFFFGYYVPKKRKVMIVDGEMAIAELKYRLLELSNGKIPESLTLLSSEKLALNNHSLNINLLPYQERINQLLDSQSPDVLILDNLSTLRFGVDENSNSDLDPLIKWFRLIRHKGIAVVIVHHAGKNGNDSRGASRLEDILDIAIRLTEIASIHDGASFKVNFTKIRGKKPVPISFQAELIDNGDGLEWICKGYEKKITIQDKVVWALNGKQYQTQKELAEHLDMDTGQLSKVLKHMLEKQLVNKSNKLKLTSAGKTYAGSVKFLFPDENLLDSL